MNQKHRSRLVIPVSIALLAACTDPVRTSAPDATPVDASAINAVAAADRERAALNEIGRLVATSLNDKGTRRQLKKHLRAAPFKEHKLELRRYATVEGKDIVRKRSEKKESNDALLTLLDQVRPLEFYMPVRKHRESWTGDEELLVAVQLEEPDPIFAFNSRGERVQLDSQVAPEQPVLSIVPVETRFDQPMSLASSKNVGDRNGSAIGTLMPLSVRTRAVMCADCVAEDGSGDGGAATGGGSGIEAGLYLEFSRILDVHEPWTKGDPEIEVHIHGPTDQGNPRIGKDLSCSGQHAYDPRKAFDQNGGFWEGRVMLFSDAEVARYNSEFNDGFHILYWEDDDTECVLKLDNDSLLEFLRSSASAFGTAAVKILKPGTPWYIIAGPFLATLFHNAGEWLRTNDDFVGALVARDAAGYGSTYPNNTHVIMQGTQLNGRATLVYR